jgi:hypothetical protein
LAKGEAQALNELALSIARGRTETNAAADAPLTLR